MVTHLFPVLPETQAELVFASPIAATYDGPILVAADGDRVRVEVERGGSGAVAPSGFRKLVNLLSLQAP